eukprot:1519786-Alexandrium_andersonii.AAC.1
MLCPQLCPASHHRRNAAGPRPALAGGYLRGSKPFLTPQRQDVEGDHAVVREDAAPDGGPD